MKDLAGNNLPDTRRSTRRRAPLQNMYINNVSELYRKTKERVFHTIRQANLYDLTPKGINRAERSGDLDSPMMTILWSLHHLSLQNRTPANFDEIVAHIKALGPQRLYRGLETAIRLGYVVKTGTRGCY